MLLCKCSVMLTFLHETRHQERRLVNANITQHCVQFAVMPPQLGLLLYLWITLELQSAQLYSVLCRDQRI